MIQFSDDKIFRHNRALDFYYIRERPRLGHRRRAEPLRHIVAGHRHRGAAPPQPEGQTLDVSYTHTPFVGNYCVSILSASGAIYFPGFWRNRSFWVQGGYERQTPHDYRFSSLILFARGYSYVFSRNFWKAGVNYTFPIYDPDWNIVHTLHFKRFYAKAFGDYSVGDGRYTRPYDFQFLLGIGMDFNTGGRRSARF